MATPKIPAEWIWTRVEAQYEANRIAAANGQVSPEQLEQLADRTTEAATILAIKKGWVLPFCK